MVGVDEVGRGSLAGPLLVVAARQTGKIPNGLTDSKLLTRQQRDALYELLTSNYEFGEGWVKPAEINRLGLSGAMRLGVKRAFRTLRVQYIEKIIMDGPVNYFPQRYRNVQCLINADATVPLVSAASIFAKVTRDRFMARLAERHPRYGFESHVGYATPQHLRALSSYGALKRVHRQSYEPVARFRQETL